MEGVPRIKEICKHLVTAEICGKRRYRCLIWELLNLVPGSITVAPIQVEALVMLQDRYKQLLIGTKTGTRWLEIMWDDEHNVLFEHHRSNQKLIDDQMERARFLVAEMQSQGLRRLRTMDGHGRFLMCFFRALQEAGENIDSYEVEICDIDPIATEWHLRLFPSNVIAYEGNILENLEAITGTAEVERTTMLYLNFCSLGHQAPDVLEFLKSLINVHHVPSIMLSFLHRNATGHGLLSDTMREFKQRFDWSMISKRGNFISTMVRPKQSKKMSNDSIEHGSSKRLRHE